MPPKARTVPTVETLRYGNVEITIELVDPAQALEWLATNNDHNRRQRENRVVAYSRDMLADAWHFTGDPIRFGEDGTMLDGQHRAAAIVRSGIAQPILIVRGLDRSAQEVMDIGAPRTLADVLGLRGEEATSQLGAVVRRLTLWNMDRMPRSDGGANATRSETMTFFDEHPEQLRRAVEVAVTSRGRGFRVPPSVIGSAYFLCAERDKAAAELFFVEQLIGNVGLDESDPANLLARRYRRGGEGDNINKLETDDGFWYALWMWNHFRRGTKGLTKIQPPRGGWPSPSEFKLL